MYLNRLKAFTSIIIVLSFLAGIVAYFISDKANIEFSTTFTLALITTLLNFGAVPLFIIGLKNFKTDLRKAYILLSVGVALLGLAQFQLPILSITGWWIWADYGGVTLPYLVAVILILFGVRTFAQLLHIRTVWTSITLATLCSIVLALFASQLPHVTTLVPELMFDITLGLGLWDTVFITFAAIAVLKIKHVLGAAYTNAMAWLFVALVVLSFAGTHFTIVSLLFAEGDWYYDYSITIVPFLLAALLLLRAGYAFNKINSSQAVLVGGFFGNHKQEVTTKGTVIDVVTYLAAQASNPREIDPILDNVRDITSRYDPARPLTDEQQTVLAQVYLQLEQYLIQQEALRSFTKEGLRQDVRRKFDLDQSTSGVFLQKISIN